MGADDGDIDLKEKIEMTSTAAVTRTMRCRLSGVTATNGGYFGRVTSM